MKNMLKAISFLGLVLTIVPAFFVLSGALTWERHALYMLMGTLMWFGTAPFWMKANKDKAHVE